MEISDQRVVISEQVACRTIDGEARIISIEDSRLHHLDPVATCIWEAIERGEGHVDALVGVVVGKYRVEPERARQDIHELLQELLRLGLVRPAG
ncbi:MAG: PqqD family protein [Myxococcota bacterium]|jgi:hypothetical protein|nr:PqqD family protein [Myxococcota bacterium]